MKKQHSKHILFDKSYAFAVRSVRLAQYLMKEKKEFILSKQILRSGTSIGALISEAKFAQSRSDFLHKLTVALKEANETHYWIRLLYDTDYINQAMFESLQKDIKEIISLLVSATKTIKENP